MFAAKMGKGVATLAVRSFPRLSCCHLKPLINLHFGVLAVLAARFM
jgi:hypothetical protein